MAKLNDSTIEKAFPAKDSATKEPPVDGPGLKGSLVLESSSAQEPVKQEPSRDLPEKNQPDQPDQPDQPAQSEEEKEPRPDSKSAPRNNETDSDSDDSSTGPRLNGINSLKDVAELIKIGKAKRIVVASGAGLSTSANIPDFRSPGGIYERVFERFKLEYPEAIFDLGYFKRKPEPFFELCKDLFPGKHLPTLAHYFIVLLHRHNVLLRVFTQNIDTLERTAGLPGNMIVEAHGSFASSHCLKCKREIDNEYMVEHARQGKVVRCPKCKGLAKPDIVFFGEGLPERFFTCMHGDLPKCDLLVVIGTSLKVHPFASIVGMVDEDCPRVLINRESVGEARGPWEDGFIFDEESRDMFYEGEADSAILELAKVLGWHEELLALMSSHHAELKEKWNIEGDSQVDDITAQLEHIGLEGEESK